MAHGHRFVDFDRFECGEQLAVDEIEQGITGESFSVFSIDGPMSPSEVFGYNRAIAVVVDLPSFFFSVVDFEKEDPDHLFDALCVAVDAGVVSHDIL